MSLMARKPGGVVSKTAAKTTAALAIGTNQLQVEQNIVMRLCGKRHQAIVSAGDDPAAAARLLSEMFFLH